MTLPYCNLLTTATDRGILLLCVLDKLNSYGLEIMRSSSEHS